MATLKELLQREKHVIIHGQTLWFRIIKYLVIVAVAVWLYRWQGGSTTVAVFLVLAVVSIAVHFLFRWKTKAWTQSWGPYKKIPFD
ncbi:MAG: hypothetical protein WEC84_04270 [Candidatus Andersenbacteria bacterium]